MTKGLRIQNETSRAYMVDDNGTSKWLPKTAVLVEDEKVTKAAKWIIEEKGLDLPVWINFTVEKVDEDKAVIRAAAKSINRQYKRRLYTRKHGQLAGSYIFTLKNSIYKFSKVNEYGYATDTEWIGDYSEEVPFGRVLKELYGSNADTDETEAEEEVEETAKEEQAKDYSKPVTHKEYETIKTCIRNDIPVYLVGPAGSGKNHTLQQIAFDLELEFYFTNSVQQEYKLTGFIDAGGKYHETEFYKAFTKGGLFFLDEMDASIPEVLVLLNAAIANRYFEFPNGKVTAHDDFRVVAAGNTLGNGADEQYTGRLVLDSATLDRFVVIEFGYDRNIEMALAKGNTELVDFINQLREQCKQTGIRATFSYRAIISVQALEYSLNLDKILTIAVFKGIDQDTLRTIQISDRTNKYWKAFEKVRVA